MRVVILSRSWQQQDLTLRCPLCELVRTFSTPTGIRRGLVEHMLADHRIQILFSARPGEPREKLTELRDHKRRQIDADLHRAGR